MLLAHSDVDHFSIFCVHWREAIICALCRVRFCPHVSFALTFVVCFCRCAITFVVVGAVFIDVCIKDRSTNLDRQPLVRQCNVENELL